MAIHAADPDRSEQLQMILFTLKEYGTSTTLTLSRMSNSVAVSTRISELRARGYDITCERKGQKYFYTLQ